MSKGNSRLQVAFIRGQFLNQYEAQTINYIPSPYEIVGFSSRFPLHTQYSFPVQKFLSPMDISRFLSSFGISTRILNGIINRICTDGHMLIGMESQLARFSIAHTAETYMYFTRQAISAKKKGLVKKVVTTVWETIPHNNEGIRGRIALKRTAIYDVDHFIATTNRAKDALLQEGVTYDKISVIYPGIDCSRFTKKTEQKKQVDTLLFVGRLEKEKGVWELFNAFRKLLRTYPKLTLTMCGTGSQKKLIEKTLCQTNLHTQVFLCSAPYTEMPKLYQKADIVVLPSKKTRHWEEQFGMVLIEAMASGVPIVANATGAIPEVVGNAGVVLSGDMTLHDGLKQLIDSREKRVMYAQRGIARVKTCFDAHTQAQKIAACYTNVLRNTTN